ncbi:hypothetical protein CHUAL_013024 [Chamberlinius hualienensis]
MASIQLFGGLSDLLQSLSDIRGIVAKITPILTPVHNISYECHTHLKLAVDGLIQTLPLILTDGFKAMDNWSYKLFDAFGKPSDGMYQLNFQWLGNFKQCMDIGLAAADFDTHTALRVALGKQQNYRSPPTAPFRGEYCLIKLTPDYQTKMNLEQMPMRIGTCFPASCSMQDKLRILNHYLQPFPVHVEISDNFCQSDAHPRTLDNLTAIVMVTLLSMITFVILSSVIQKLRRKISTASNSNNSKLDAVSSVIQSFSLQHNIGKLWSKNQQKPLNYLEPMKLISMLWVFLEHTFLIIDYKDITYANKLDYIQTYESLGHQPIFLSRYAFYTLFQLTALKLSYQMFDCFQNAGPTSFISILIRRLIKIVPIYVFIVMFMMGPMSYIGDGPMWPTQIQLTKQCQQNWWKLLLFIFNINIDSNQCNPTFWYPSVEVQLCLIIPVIAYFLYKKPLIGATVIITCLIISNVLQSLFIYFYDVTVIPSVSLSLQTRNSSTPNFNNIYKQPWGHLAPTLTGILVGYLLHTHRCTINSLVSRRVINLTGWCFSIGVIMGLIYGTYPLVSSTVSLTTAINTTYGCLTTYVWSIATAWIILAVSAKEHEDNDRHNLQSKILRLLDRLTYSAYLVHFLFISYHFNSAKVIWHFDGYNNTILLITVAIGSYLTALILTLIVGLPVSNLIELCHTKCANYGGHSQYTKLSDLRRS